MLESWTTSFRLWIRGSANVPIPLLSLSKPR
jgi:hypothetical protein